MKYKPLLVKIMRITFLQLAIIFTLVGSALAKEGKAQAALDIKITLNQPNITLKELFKKLEDKYNVNFVYSAALINENQRVSAVINQQQLLAVLKNILTPLKLKFNSSGDVIVINNIIDNNNVTNATEEQKQEQQIQQSTITGKVVDEKNSPIPGVVIKVKGSSQGTSTNNNGIYSIVVPNADAVLVYSFLGYEEQEHPVGQQSIINIILKEKKNDLNEVVVIGYGTQKRSDLTGAIGVVSNQTLVNTAKVSPIGALQGVVAGVSVTRSTNKPGGGYGINIRGIHSITGTNAPLIVVDGIPGADLDKINPADIEHIDILKDASATAIYGSRGANGVLIVTTKRGVTGKPKISYSGYAGVRDYTNIPDMMTGDQYVQLAREARRATNNNMYLPDEQVFTDPSELQSVQTHKYYDWIGNISKSAVQTSHSISATGGTDDAKYALSGGYYHEGGMLEPQYYTRYNLRAVIDLKANNYLSFGGSMYYTSDVRETGNSDLLGASFRFRPTQFPNSLITGQQIFNYPSNGLFNGFVTEKNEFNNTKGGNVLGNVYINLTPVKGLSIKSSFSPYVANTQVGGYTGVNTKALQGTAAGATDKLSKATNTNWILDNIINYKWNKGVNAFEATGVYSLQKNQSESLNAASKDLSFNSLYYNIGGGTFTSFGSGYTQSQLASYLGRVNYSLMDRYLFTASARYDGSSKLAEGHKWVLFPSAAVAWRVSEEPFIKQASWIDNLKLRLSYGETGNDSVSPYQSNQLISGTQYYSFGSDVLGNSPNNLPNPDLTWEKTSEFNLGLDFGFFHNRVLGSVEFYNRLTKDLIMNKVIPVTTGYKAITANVGSVRNKGVELTLTTVNLQSQNFRWSTTFSVAYNHNAIVDLGFKEDLGKYSPQLVGVKGDYTNRWFIGKPIQSNWDLISTGVWQLSEAAEAAKYGQKPGQFKVKDFDNDGTINTDKDRILDGKRSPDYTGGFSTNVQYKNFDLSAQAFFQTGARDRNQFYVSYSLENNAANFNNLKSNYWTPENPSNTMAQPSNMGPYRDQNALTNGNLTSVSHEVQKTDFLKVAYISLGYTFNKNLLSKYKIGNLRIYATVQNPFTFSGWSGFDPEQPTGEISSSDLITRNLLFGLDISFK